MVVDDLHLLDLTESSRILMQEFSDCSQIFLKRTREAFTCGCCLEIVFEPIALICGHSLCEVCNILCFEFLLTNYSLILNPTELSCQFG